MHIKALALAGLIIGSGLLGCTTDNTPPPPRVAVPPPGYQEPLVMHDPVKPLPDQNQADTLPPPPYDDVPLVDQRIPEQGAYVDAYNRVGRPRITVFMNRTLEGQIIPVVPSNNPPTDYQRPRDDGSQGRDTSGYPESKDIYLQPGQYDEAWAKNIDYEAIENVLADWMAGSGQITMIAPTLARQRLTDEQVRDIQSGRPIALSEVAQQLGADVLIQVQARPTSQTSENLKVRIIAEAMNTKGGQSIGRVFVDVPLPLEKTTINKFTRFLARKLMSDMTGAWLAPPAPDMRRDNPRDSTPVNPPLGQPQPTQPPAPQPQPSVPPVAPPAPPSNPPPQPLPPPNRPLPIDPSAPATSPPATQPSNFPPSGYGPG